MLSPSVSERLDTGVIPHIEWFTGPIIIMAQALLIMVRNCIPFWQEMGRCTTG
jgi:hypothetical protein